MSGDFVSYLFGLLSFHLFADVVDILAPVLCTRFHKLVEISPAPVRESLKQTILSTVFTTLHINDKMSDQIATHSTYSLTFCNSSSFSFSCSSLRGSALSIFSCSVAWYSSGLAISGFSGLRGTYTTTRGNIQ